MTAKKKKGTRRKRARKLTVKLGGPRRLLTADRIARAVEKKLAAEPTGLFAHADTLVLLLQHQLGGKRGPE